MEKKYKKTWVFIAVVIFVAAFFVGAINNSQLNVASLINFDRDPMSHDVVESSDEIVPETFPEVIPEVALEVTPVVPEKSLQDKLDDIAEQIDIIQREINDLVLAEKAKEIASNNKIDEQKVDENDKVEVEVTVVDESVAEPNNIITTQNSGTRIVYPKILISEVQIEGENDSKQEFVELYNPNNQDVYLTDWYLQRKTKTADSYSTYVSSNTFLGKKILARNYFLIARSGSDFAGLAGVVTENPLTQDNSLVLKDPNRDISDLLGFGQATDYEGNLAENPLPGKSIGRKWQDNSEQDTDNNFVDFQTQTPTPKSYNVKYVDPVLLDNSGSETPVIKNILINEVQAEPIASRFIKLYNPNDQEVDLTGYYIQRKTQNSDSFESLVSSTNFENKKISANGYFLISREITGSDILLDITLSQGNLIVLKNKNREIVDSFVIDIKDTTPPVIAFGEVSATQSALNFAINFTITDIDSFATPSGVGGYVFRWKADASDWQEDLPVEAGGAVSGSFTKDFVGENGKTYYFQVKAKDGLGNESEWLPAEPVFTKIEIPLPIEIKPIIINEVQTEGVNSKDEFVELYNPNNSDINLIGYALKKKTSSGAESNLVSSASFSGTIVAFGYYLIAPQNNDDGTPNYTGSVAPDLFYSGKSYSIADNNTVLLYNKEGVLQDKVGFGNATDFEELATVNPSKSKSISRVNNVDINDNGKDFVILDSPTPKAQ